MFQGFSRESAGFFSGLAADNNREWFNDHKADYLRIIRQPMEDLLGEAEAIYGSGHITRPNRDVRFAADKTPYRLDAGMWAGEIGAVYLRLTATEIEAGGGLYDPSRDQLERSRRSIDSAPLAATQLTSILGDLEESGFTIESSPLKTAPRGYEKDHPSIELLRMTRYASTRKLPIDASREAIFESWQQIAPLNGWLADRVGKATSWP